MKPENLVEGIHLEDYQRPYESKIMNIWAGIILILADWP